RATPRDVARRCAPSRHNTSGPRVRPGPHRPRIRPRPPVRRPWASELTSWIGGSIPILPDRQAEETEPASLDVCRRRRGGKGPARTSTIRQASTCSWPRANARTQGRRLLLVRPRGAADRIFRLTLLEDRFEFVEAPAAEG